MLAELNETLAELNETLAELNETLAELNGEYSSNRIKQAYLRISDCREQAAY
jgi:uncharacterized coiled-coil protein SlyX